MSDDRAPISVGTRVVSTVEVETPAGVRPDGTVAEVVRVPPADTEPYTICFADGTQSRVERSELEILSHFQEPDRPEEPASFATLTETVFFECVVGSRAHGLGGEDSDRDIRGIFLPPARMHWSLWDVPEQLEDQTADVVYWEIAKFLRLALRASPNVLELLYSPMILRCDEVGDRLLDSREAFLSGLVYQSHMGYALSQHRRLQDGREEDGAYDAKGALHMIRLLIAAIDILETGTVEVEVGERREELLSIKQGEISWKELEVLRRELVDRLERAHAETDLPERPDYETANQFLIWARRRAVE